MDLPSKIIAISLFFFPIVLLGTLESNMNEIEDKDQIVLNAIESVLITEDTKHNLYFDDMDYTPELGAQNLGGKFNIQYDLSAKKLSNLSQYEYYIIGPKKNGQTVAYLHHDDCNKEKAQIEWKDGVAHTITYKGNTFVIGYNEAGLVRTLTNEHIDRKSKVDKHTLTYTEDEKIATVTATRFSKKGKEANEIVSKETNYHYTENKIEIAHTTFLEQDDQQQPTIQKVDYITFVLDDLALTRINYQSNNRSVIESMDETILNEDGQIIRRVHSKPGQGNTSIDSFEYNERGQVLRSSTLVASMDSIISHKESHYAYDEIDSNDQLANNCNQQVNLTHTIYDENGNLANTFTETAF